MPRFFTAAIFGTVAGLFLWAGPTMARAALMTGLAVDVTAQAGGLYEYDYTLSVPQASTLGASQLFFAVSTDGNLAGLSAPGGWDVFRHAGRSRHLVPIIVARLGHRAGELRLVLRDQPHRAVGERLPRPRLRRHRGHASITTPGPS